MKPDPGRIISLCAGLPLVSKYTRPMAGRAGGGEGGAGGRGNINHSGSLSPSRAADSLGALLAQLAPFLEELGPGRSGCEWGSGTRVWQAHGHSPHHSWGMTL